MPTPHETRRCVECLLSNLLLLTSACSSLLARVRAQGIFQIPRTMSPARLGLVGWHAMSFSAKQVLGSSLMPPSLRGDRRIAITWMIPTPKPNHSVVTFTSTIH